MQAPCNVCSIFGVLLRRRLEVWLEVVVRSRRLMRRRPAPGHHDSLFPLCDLCSKLWSRKPKEKQINKCESGKSRIFADSMIRFTATRARRRRLPTPEYRPTPHATAARIASVHPARAVWGLGAPLAVRASTFRTNNRDGSSQRQLFGRPTTGVCRRRSGTGGYTYGCLPTNRDY